MSFEDLTPIECQAALQADPELQPLDVRTAPEYQAYRIEGSQLLPVQELETRMAELDPGKRYLLICEHGRRSLFAAQLLAHNGFDKLINLSGGMAAWIEDGLPCER